MTMKIILGLVLLALLDLSIAGKIKKDYNSKHYSHDSGHYGVYEDHSYGAGYGYEGHHGYKEEYKGKDAYAGSGLRFIAQGSANQANSAVAKQYAAAQQAAYAVKNSLAQSASQAAATALAALQGKEALLQRLEQQFAEASRRIEDELGQLLLARKSAKAASQAAQQASYHVDVLSAAINNAKITAGHAHTAASDSAAELAAQTSMVGQSKAQLDEVKQRLGEVRLGYIATKEAADKASYSAYEAQKNAKENEQFGGHGKYIEGEHHYVEPHEHHYVQPIEHHEYHHSGHGYGAYP